MEKALEILRRLERVYPDRIELEFSNPFELLIAIILSAQTTDRKTNEVTKRLFGVYKTPQELSKADIKEIEKLIRGVNYAERKAEFIKEVSSIIAQRGDIPKSVQELVKLPGVGRKTASMFLYNAYRINEGIAVDTHVERVVKRLGLSKANTREKIEEELMKLLPHQEWGKFSNLLILHGRYTCTAKNPKCGECVIRELCPYPKGP